MPGHAHVGPPLGQWTMYRSTQLDPEPLEAALDLCDRVSPSGIELGRDEDLIARDTAFAQPLPDALLVAVGLGGVDVPIAEFERPADRVDALASVRHLPDAEAQQRQLRTVPKVRSR